MIILMSLTYVASFNKKLTNFSPDQKPLLILNKHNCRLQPQQSYSKFTKLLSHLSAQVVNHQLCENRMSIPNFFNGKKLLKNVTLQILNFILVS